MKNIKAFLVFSAITLTGSLIAGAQKQSPDEIKRIVESQNYVFKAQMANPQGFMSRPLTSDYDLSVTKDTLVSFLPYFGRAYVAPVNPSEGGIKFTSTKFDYKQAIKGQSWRITIRPKDAPDVQELYLDIFDNGRATLQVSSANRQWISFSGYVEENKPKAKKAF